jgi:hypothetical protein
MRLRTGILFTAVLAAAISFWWKASSIRRKAEAEQILLIKRKRELIAEMERFKNSDPVAAQLPVTQPASPPKSSVAAEETNLALRLRTRTQRPWSSGTIYGDQALVNTDQKLQLLELQRQRASISLYYGEFFGSQRLSPAQIERLIEAKLKLEELAMDLDALGRTQDATGRQAMATMERQAAMEHDAILNETLGPEGSRALLEYERTQPWRRTIVNGFAGVAALAGTPITAEQGKQLLQAALEATPSDLNPENPNTLSALDLAALDAQARRILSPAQFDFFSGLNSWRTSLEQQSVMRKVREGEEARGH